MSKQTKEQIIECSDSWLKDAELPTYTELLAALTDLVSRCDGEEGVRADGSNIQTYAANAAITKANAA